MPKRSQTIVDMMMSSRETFVNYTMPLGLHHLIGGNHYAPMPENAKAQRADWTAVYYHQASADGIGFDRTMKGDKAVGQYFPPVRDMFDNLATCPEKFLLWFHRCGWDYKLKSGKTLWDGLVRALLSRARSRPRRCRRPGSRSPARSIRSGTRKSPTGWRSRSPTPPSGATTSCSTSRASVADHWFGASQARTRLHGVTHLSDVRSALLQDRLADRFRAPARTAPGSHGTPR